MNNNLKLNNQINQNIKDNIKKSIDEIIKLNAKFNKLNESISITDNAIYFRKKQISLEQPTDDSNELATIGYVNTKLITPLVSGQVNLQHQPTSLSTKGNIQIQGLTLSKSNIEYDNKNLNFLNIYDYTNNDNNLGSINCNVLNCDTVKYNKLDPPISLDNVDFTNLNIKCKTLDILKKNNDETYNYLFKTYINNENYDNSLIQLKNLIVGDENNEGKIIIYVKKDNIIQPFDINQYILQNQNLDSIVSFVNSINNNNSSINVDYTNSGNIKSNIINTSQLIVEKINNSLNDDYNIKFSTLPYYNGTPISSSSQIDPNCFITKDLLTKLTTNINARLDLTSDTSDGQLNIYIANEPTFNRDIGINIYGKSIKNTYSVSDYYTHIDYEKIQTKHQSNDTLYNININNFLIGYDNTQLNAFIKYNLNDNITKDIINLSFVNDNKIKQIDLYTSSINLYDNTINNSQKIILNNNNKNIIQNINDIKLLFDMNNSSNNTSNLIYNYINENNELSNDYNIISSYTSKNNNNDNDNDKYISTIKINGTDYLCNNTEIINSSDGDINIININDIHIKNIILFENNGTNTDEHYIKYNYYNDSSYNVLSMNYDGQNNKLNVILDCTEIHINNYIIKNDTVNNNIQTLLQYKYTNDDETNYQNIIISQTKTITQGEQEINYPYTTIKCNEININEYIIKNNNNNQSLLQYEYKNNNILNYQDIIISQTKSITQGEQEINYPYTTIKCNEININDGYIIKNNNNQSLLQYEYKNNNVLNYQDIIISQIETITQDNQEISYPHTEIKCDNLFLTNGIKHNDSYIIKFENNEVTSYINNNMSDIKIYNNPIDKEYLNLLSNGITYKSLYYDSEKELISIYNENNTIYTSFNLYNVNHFLKIKSVDSVEHQSSESYLSISVIYENNTYILQFIDTKSGKTFKINAST